MSPGPKELLDLKPEWEEREASAWKQLSEGQIPTIGAGVILNRPLTDLILLPSLANATQPDLRRRSIVHAYSGARPASVNVTSRTIALELSSALTLIRVGVWHETISAFEHVLIPVDLIGALFDELRRAKFHQPSRIKEAHALTRLIAGQAIRVMHREASVDHALAQDVGVDLASMLSTIRAKSDQDGGPARYVVRSGPVRRADSLLEEEVDLSAYGPWLCSCQAVVEKLRAKGTLSLDETERALGYLCLHERRWPNEPMIADGAEIYLDDLSVIYLRGAGILHKLKTAGLVPFITETCERSANDLVMMEDLTQQKIDFIHAARKQLSAGLRTDKIRAVGSGQEHLDDLLTMHPMLSVLNLDPPPDAFVVDDRFINRHLQAETTRGTRPIINTLDLLDHLASQNQISDARHFACRTSLRQAGYQLIPVSLPELLYYMDGAQVVGGHLAETAELRAIREAILKVRMSKILQLPLEALWLDQTVGSLIKCAKELWKSKPPREAAVYADWLIDLIDLRGWAPAALPGSEHTFPAAVHAAHVQALAWAPDNVAEQVRDAYHEWIDEKIVDPLRYSDPEVFCFIVRHTSNVISRQIDRILEAEVQP